MRQINVNAIKLIKSTNAKIFKRTNTRTNTNEEVYEQMCKDANKRTTEQTYKKPHKLKDILTATTKTCKGTKKQKFE